MGLFSSLKNAILSKISHRRDETVSRKPSVTPGVQKQSPTPEPPSHGTGAAPAAPTQQQSQQPEPQRRLTAAELEQQLDDLAAESKEKLDWKHSIVDLMKLVGMDSSYAERKEMALDLGYSKEDIDSKGSAEMNIWLHKRVMEKLSEDTDGDLTIA